MMKWIASILIVANLGAWMWIRWHADDVAEVPAPQARPEVEPQKLRLLSEPGVKLVARAPVPPPVVEAPALKCARLGPFTAAEEVARVAEGLKERDMKAERREEERRAVSGYRVFLPPFPSRKAAEAMRAKLKRLGFRDHAVIEEPGMENALSLGLYSTEANAEQHSRRLNKKGVKAEVQTLHQTRVVHWLELSTTEQALASLMETPWGEGISVLVEPCAAAPAPAPPPP